MEKEEELEELIKEYDILLEDYRTLEFSYNFTLCLYWLLVACILAPVVIDIFKWCIK